MMEWKIRDEKHSRFWEDKWVGRIVCKIPLQDYTLYQSKNGRVFIKWEEWNMANGVGTLNGGNNGLNGIGYSGGFAKFSW